MRELKRLRRLLEKAKTLQEVRDPEASFETGPFRDARIALFQELKLQARDTKYLQEDFYRFYYVASPYSAKPGPNQKRTQQRRFEQVRDFVTDCYAVDIPVFSPILHWHPAAEAGNLPTTAEHFDVQNKSMLGSSAGVIVFRMRGWDKSVGVRREVALAKDLGLPVIYAADAPYLDDPLEGVKELKRRLDEL